MTKKTTSPYINHRCTLEVKGKIVSKPILGYSAKGLPYLTFTVVYGHDRCPPVFFDFVAFKEMAEAIHNEFIKGDIIHVSKAFPRAQTWIDKDGKKNNRTKWWVVALGGSDKNIQNRATKLPHKGYKPSAQVEEVDLDYIY